jgi:hypothetical protein
MKNLEGLKNEVFQLKNTKSNINGGSNWIGELLGKITTDHRVSPVTGEVVVFDDNGKYIASSNP